MTVRPPRTVSGLISTGISAVGRRSSNHSACELSVSFFFGVKKIALVPLSGSDSGKSSTSSRVFPRVARSFLSSFRNNSRSGPFLEVGISILLSILDRSDSFRVNYSQMVPNAVSIRLAAPPCVPRGWELSKGWRRGRRARSLPHTLHCITTAEGSRQKYV